MRRITGEAIAVISAAALLLSILLSKQAVKRKEAGKTSNPNNCFALLARTWYISTLKVVFDKLAEGAEKERFQELHDMPFGTYGQFYDSYGVQWIFKGEKKE